MEAVGCLMPRRNQQQISMDVVIHHNDHDHETPVAVANLEDSLTLGLKDVETNGYNNTNVQVHIEVAMQKKESRPFLQASAINNNTVCVACLPFCLHNYGICLCKKTAVTDQEKRNLKTDAVSEVFSIIGLLIKFVAVTIFFIMLKDESPVSEYYQVNRAVKDTFMVDQAMEVILHQVCLAAYV